MLNQAILVGRLASDIEICDDKAVITINVPRLNSKEEPDSDNIRCLVYGTIAKNMQDYCKQGDIVGIKGRIQVVDDVMQIVTEKVTFLASHSNDEEEEKDEDGVTIVCQDKE